MPDFSVTGAPTFPAGVLTTGGHEAPGSDCAISVGRMATSIAWGTANLVIYLPLVIQQRVTVLEMACKNFATVAGNVDVGIYSEAGTRLVNSGSTAQAGTSTIQKVGIADTTIGPGTYFFALTASNTTATFSGNATSSALHRASYRQAETTAAFGLPATATFSPIASNRYAFIAAFYVSTAA